MNFEEWKNDVPEAIKRDVIWKLDVYQASLILSDLAWHDASKLLEQR